MIFIVYQRLDYLTHYEVPTPADYDTRLELYGLLCNRHQVDSLNTKSRHRPTSTMQYDRQEFKYIYRNLQDQCYVYDREFGVYLYEIRHRPTTILGLNYMVSIVYQRLAYLAQYEEPTPADTGACLLLCVYILQIQLYDEPTPADNDTCLVLYDCHSILETSLTIPIRSADTGRQRYTA